MPKLTEWSTVEWHSAHWMPTDFSVASLSKKPVSPTTAFALRSASVPAGLSRSSRPACSAPFAPCSASASTFNPRASAVRGVMPEPTPPKELPSIARCNPSVSPQKASSPKVSKRNVARP